MSVLDKLAEKINLRKREKVSTWNDLVRAIAVGKEPSADKVEAILEDVGKTLDNLRVAVANYQSRKVLADQVKAGSDATTELVELEEKAKAQVEKFKEAEAAHEELMHPIRWRAEQCRQAIRQASAAEQELRRTCNRPEVIDRQQSIHVRQQQIGAERRKQQDMLETARANARGRDALAEEGGSLEATYRQEAADALKRADGYAAEIAELNRELDEIGKQEQELMEEMLKP